MDYLRGIPKPQKSERVCPFLIERGLRNRRRGATVSATMARRETIPVYLGGKSREIMNAEEREKIFLAMTEDFSAVIAKHLTSFDNNIEGDTWKLLEVFTEEVIEQLA
jgi:hypothetical protein